MKSVNRFIACLIGTSIIIIQSCNNKEIQFLKLDDLIHLDTIDFKDKEMFLLDKGFKLERIQDSKQVFIIEEENSQFPLQSLIIETQNNGVEYATQNSEHFKIINDEINSRLNFFMDIKDYDGAIKHTYMNKNIISDKIGINASTKTTTVANNSDPLHIIKISVNVKEK